MAPITNRTGFCHSSSVVKITTSATNNIPAESQDATSLPPSPTATIQKHIHNDKLTIEEPMEIVIEQELLTGLATTSVYVTMRTPGQDFHLAKGFLFSEGFIQAESDILAIKHCGPEMPPHQLQNIVKVTLCPTVNWQNQRAKRQVQGNSSCGLCGITSLQAVKMGIPAISSDIHISPEQLLALESELVHHQPLFTQTGGIHAVSLFRQDENKQIQHMITMEDVGRHNAMDKIIGYALEQQHLPLHNCLIITTSRASFELVQKSARAGCALLAAVSAPSSLAVQLAQEVNQTLVGFLRAGRLNLYTDQANRLSDTTS